MAMAASGTRDGRGRFVPGMSGNPAGKKPGTLNKATLWRQAMAEGDELDGRRQVIARMREGDLRAAMFVLKQIDGPDRKVAALALPIPPGSDVATVFASIKAKMILGEVSPDEALAWFTALERGVRVVMAQMERGSVIRQMEAASAVAAAAEADARTDGPPPEDGGGARAPDGERPPEADDAPDEPHGAGTATAPDAGIRMTAGAASRAPAAPDVPDASASESAAPSFPQADAVPAAPPVTAAPVTASRDIPAPAAQAPLFQPPSRLAAPATPEALAAASVQPCISPAFPGRRRKILAARAAGLIPAQNPNM